MRAVLTTKQRRIKCSGCKHYEKLHLRKEKYKHILGKVCVATPYKVRQFEYNK